MGEYKRIKLNLKPRTPAQMRGLFKTAGAKGSRIIGGQKFFLRGTVSTKREARRIAKQHRETHYTRIYRSRQYGDYELWMRRR